MLPEDEISTEDMATSQAMNGGLSASPVSGYIPAPPPAAPVMTQSVPATAPVSTNGNETYQVTTTVTPSAPTTAPTAQSTGDYSSYVLSVNTPWPPPLFARPNMKPEERFYLENRWYSQWTFFDKKASDSKKRYLQLQQIIVIGSVVVPVLVAFGPNVTTIIPASSTLIARFFIDVATVIISTSVAVAAAWEGLHKNGDAWSTYRRAAEEMQQEKFTFDVRAGRYASEANAYTRFVERTEEIIAQQNGRYFQTIEKQQQQAAEQNQEILGKYRDQGETTVTVTSPISSTSTVAVETSSAPVQVAAAPVAVEDSSAG